MLVFMWPVGPPSRVFGLGLLGSTNLSSRVMGHDDLILEPVGCEELVEVLK